MKLEIRKIGDRYWAKAKRPREQIDWETLSPMEMEPLIEKLLQLGFNYRDVQDIITEANDRGEGHMGTDSL
jgi:hypothetical protein